MSKFNFIYLSHKGFFNLVCVIRLALQCLWASAGMRGHSFMLEGHPQETISNSGIIKIVFGN